MLCSYHTRNLFVPCNFSVCALFFLKISDIDKAKTSKCCNEFQVHWFMVRIS